MALGFIKKIFSFGKEDKQPSATETDLPATESVAGHDPALPPADPIADALDLSDDIMAGRAEERARLEALRDQQADLPASIVDEIVGEEEIVAAESVAAILSVEDQLALDIADQQHPAPDEVEAPTIAEPVLPAGFASAAARAPEPVVEPERRKTWIERLRQGLSRTSAQLTSQITSLFTKRKLDEETLQDL